MVRTIFVAGALALGAAAAVAQANVIEQRQNLMKEHGAMVRPASAMLRGQAPFNLEQVQTALRTFSRNAKVAPTLFPDNSKTGGDTKALPAIWDSKADFEGIFVKFDQDAQAALAAIKDEPTFKAEFPKVLQNCSACHDRYRRSG
jgi:cytochrome c556